VILDQTLICTGQSQGSVEGSNRSYWMMEWIKTSFTCHHVLPDTMLLRDSSTSNLDHKTSSICYKTYKIHNSHPGAALLHKLSYSWLRRLRTIQQDTWWIEAAHQKGIYRPKSDVHRLGAPIEQVWQRSQWKDRKQQEEDTYVKEQYLRTGIFERIYQHCTPHDYR
jgi:hypothetical protein